MRRARWVKWIGIGERVGNQGVHGGLLALILSSAVTFAVSARCG